jgi:hypothetical protein
MLRPLSKESSDTDYTVAIFICNLFYAIDDGGKNDEQFGIMILLFLSFLFFKLRYIVCIM